MRRGSKTSPKHTNGLDPFNDEDDDVKRIAAEMEAKYVRLNPYLCQSRDIMVFCFT